MSSHLLCLCWTRKYDGNLMLIFHRCRAYVTLWPNNKVSTNIAQDHQQVGLLMGHRLLRCPINKST